MENNMDLELAQAEYLEVKSGLQRKAFILGLCTLSFFVMFRLLTKDTTFFACLRDGFYFALLMYLPFRICYESTGSIIGSFIGSFVLVFIVGLVLGDSSALLGWILFGGMVADFGWSIYRIYTLRKMLTGATQ